LRNCDTADVFGDHLIKNLYQLKGYKATELTNEFPNKCWTTSSIKRLLKKLRDTGTVNKLREITADHEVPHWRKCWPG